MLQTEFWSLMPGTLSQHGLVNTAKLMVLGIHFSAVHHDPWPSKLFRIKAMDCLISTNPS